MRGLHKHFDFTASTAAEGLGLVVASYARNAHCQKQAENEHQPNRLVQFPKRPDVAALSETIPLFFIALNNHGFWVAREADGRCGGLFLFRHFAVRFAQRKSSPAGCATMFLDEPLELDVANDGNRIVEPLTSVIDFARRRAPALTAFVMMAIAKLRKLDGQLLRFCAREPKNRVLPELTCGRYTLSSKNGDGTSFP